MLSLCFYFADSFARSGESALSVSESSVFPTVVKKKMEKKNTFPPGEINGIFLTCLVSQGCILGVSVESGGCWKLRFSGLWCNLVVIYVMSLRLWDTSAMGDAVTGPSVGFCWLQIFPVAR